MCRTIRSLMKVGMLGLGIIILLTLTVGCTKTTVEEGVVACPPITVQQYWDMYGQYPTGTWNVKTADELEWFKPVALHPYRLGALVPHIKDPYWVGNAYGIWQAAKDLGITIEFMAADGYGDMVGQSRQIDDLIVKGVDGILIASVDYAAMGPIVKSAWDKGIFVAYNQVPADDPYAPSTERDWHAAGWQIGAAYGDRWPVGRVIVLSGPPGVTWAEGSGRGIADALKTYPGIEVVTVRSHEMDLPKIMSLTEDLLTTYGKVDAILSYTDFGAKGIIAALRSAGYAPGEVKTSGNPVNKETVELMKEGWFTLGQSDAPCRHGASTVWLLVNMLNGSPVPHTLNLPTRIITLEDLPQVEAELEGLEYAPAGWMPGAVLK